MATPSRLTNTRFKSRSSRGQSRTWNTGILADGTTGKRKGGPSTVMVVIMVLASVLFVSMYLIRPADRTGGTTEFERPAAGIGGAAGGAREEGRTFSVTPEHSTMSRGDTRDTTRSTGGGDWKMNGQAIMNGPSGRPSKEIGVSSGGGDADIHSVGGTVNTLLQPHLDGKIRIPEVTQGASQSRLPFRRDGELNRQAAWDEHIPDEFLQLKPSENADELTADGTHRDEELEPVTLEKIFKLNLGRERPQPDQAKVENICMLKTHKTASTTLGSILFRFAAKNHLSVYNREGHELKKWRFWFEGDIDEPVHKYNMVITHYGKSTGTRRETWYTNDKPDDSNDDTEQDDSGATAVSIPVSAPATDIDVQDQEEEEDQEEDQDEQKEEEQEEEQGEEKRGDTPASRGLMSAAGPVVEGDEEDHQEEEEADSKNPVSDSQATEESLPGDIAEISSPDADAVAPAQQQVYRDITLQNFTDWCSSVVRPSSSDATFRTITTIREPVGHFLSWYFFYIEPELTYNFGDERFAADDGSATANGTHQDDGHGDDDDGDPGGWYASRAAVADRLYLWMQWHGTDPNGDVPADAKNETDVVQVLDEEDETVGDNKTVSLDNTFNHQAREFLLWSDVHVQEFLDMHEQRMTDSNSSNLLDFVMLADRFDESLIVLRHMLNWDMSDLTYLRMLNAGGTGSKPLLRWDGLPIKNNLRKTHLNETLLSFIESNTMYDRMMYDFFGSALDTRLAGLREAGVDIEGELATLKAMETFLERMCDSRGNMATDETDGGRARTAEEDLICQFYAMDDLTYEATIANDGSPRGVPMYLAPDSR